MARQITRRQGRRLGSVFSGLLLAELGLLQFFKVHFGIEWSEMWPLSLMLPGLALVLAGLIERHPTKDDRPDMP